MNSKARWASLCFLAICLFTGTELMAHNGTVGHAYPLGRIKVDGDFSDWPRDAVRYPIAMHLSDTKPKDDADFSGYFQMGYRLDNHSLYFAFTITDNDFIEDTSKYVQWNSQDGLELSIDARHLQAGSGVASFMYSKKLRNTNHAQYDPFAKKINWDKMEVAIVTRGNQRFYEWRMDLGEELVVGKSVGFDFHVFDLDHDKSFSWSAWGGGGFKFRDPNSLGDVILLPANQKLGTVSGHIGWENPTKIPLPGQVRISQQTGNGLWLEASVDSMGNFSAKVPPGRYQVTMPDEYVHYKNKIYSIALQKPVNFSTKAGNHTKSPSLSVRSSLAPDLLPEKGILHDFSPARAAEMDKFIEAYRRYYKIPGVSLALIKDGKLVYHKTYGAKNAMTREKVDGSTLFEAASVTKPVFAFAVQRLAEKGVIDMDKPLYLYLPYPDIEYDERYKLITARHVLTHQTGFPNWRSMNPDGKLNIRFTPGTGYGYSGEGFEYLKMAVEKITGKKVEQVLEEEVIRPMGLYRTFFSQNDSLNRMVALGHYDGFPNSDPPPKDPGMAYSMHTEANTFTRFMLYLLQQKGLKLSTYDTMFQKHSEYNYDPEDEKPKYPAYMGMSLEIRETPWGKSFGHGGNNGDFKCKFEVYMQRGMGYVLFTNSNTSDVLLTNIRKFLVEGKDL